MEFIYIVIENGEAYPNAYKTYKAAVKAVNIKHQEELDSQIEELPEYKNSIIADVNPEESGNGTTQLYIEKGIAILIHKLPIDASSGGRRKGSRRQRNTFS